MKLVQRLFVGLALVCLQLSAHAEEQVIEEVLVTATKRDTDLMDVAASVTAFTSNQLDERGIESFEDLNSVPNLNSGLSYGQVFMTIRGVGFSNAQGTVDPNVAQHVDGVYMPRTSGLRGAYHDLESLEVLRGPQGTLYGRNSTGGSVNLITAKPTEEFEGRLGLLAGDYDRRQVSGLVSGPISENVLGRLSVLYDERDHYTENLFPGADDVDDEEIKSVRGALRFIPSDDLTIDLSLHHEEREGSFLFDTYTPPSNLFFPIYNDPNALFTAEPHKTYSDIDTFDERETTIATLSVDWALSHNVTLISKTGLVNSEFFARTDNDGVSVLSVDATTGHDSDTFSQELNLHFALMDNRLDLLTGVYFYSDELEWESSLDLGFLDNLFGLPPRSSNLSFAYDQDTDAYGVFVDATYHVSDDWRIYGGIRYSDEEKDGEMLVFQVGFALCGFGAPVSNLDGDWDDTSFRVGVQHDLSAQSTVYGQYSQGFRSGGFDTSSCNDEYDQENVDAFEIGYKATLLDGRMALRTAAFFYEYDDLQLAQIVGLTLNVDNAAKSEVWGAEVEAQIRVTERLQISVNYAYLDATYDEYSDCDGLLFPGNCTPDAIAMGFSVSEDVSGNPLNRAPEHSFGVIADYFLPLDNGGEVGITAEWNWTDDIQYRPFDNEADQQDAYSITNLFVSYKPSGDSNLTLRAYGKNLGDEEYVHSLTANTSVAINLLTMPWAPPRTWGVEAVWDF